MNYPYDIISYVRKKTFSIEARFTEEKEESPLKIFNNTFSRFVFTVISDGKAATSNVHLQDLAGIISKSNYAFNKHMESRYENNDSMPQSAGFTTRFTSGSFKGKTPVEILLENGDNGKDLLNKQYTWLKQNLEKYPNNKKLMDAIVDASKADLSNVSINAIADAKPIEILNIGARPLVRKQREDKKCFCYECFVTWNISKDYPVSVTVKNYYAPVVEKDGLYNVIIKEKDQSSEIANTFNMTAEEWLNAVEEMNQIKNDFRMLHVKNAFVLAENADKENREAASRQAS